MVKNILLKMDKKFFNKMQEHKLRLEIRRDKKITWEDYVKILFGMETGK